MKQLQEALNQCTVSENSIKHPSTQLDRKVYVELKKALTGMWGS